ncbi:hypothetical protein [Sandaracinus amylolyticus]|uniref:Coenzyme PQQ synthesis protein A n=1 Tax=Sandaracinus amylolyticus TaxID=927083 RepID=A0A0F6W0P3_9BACT|nr:hypothetical protein [Sandaracinus amylolyticus]AKF04252.1 hypothetical protein DB32_001401 [Sandaracinus amylolyticus]
MEPIDADLAPEPDEDDDEWAPPTFVEIKMDAEIGAYQSDDATS